MAGYFVAPVEVVDMPTTPTPITRYGGKCRMATRIADLLPPHRCYVEPYAGSAAVMFAKSPSAVEFLNDLDPDVFNFYSILQNEGDELYKRLKAIPYNADSFNAARLPTSDALEQAVGFFVRMRLSYGSLGVHYNKITVKREDVTYANAIERLPKAAARIADVIVEQRDATELLVGHDRRGVVVYIDPPYHHSARGRNNKMKYAYEMDDQQHEALLKVITSYRYGKVIVSGYDCELYRGYLGGWRKIEREVVTSVGNGGKTGIAPRRIEVLWLNFD